MPTAQCPTLRLIQLATLVSLLLVAAAPSRAMTVDEAVAQALKVDPSVLLTASRRSASDVEAQRAAAYLPSNPYLTTSVSSSTFEQTVSDIPEPNGSFKTKKAGPAVTVYVEQEIEIAGQRGLRVESAEVNKRVSALNHTHAEREVTAQVRNAFYAVLVQRELADLEGDAVHWEKEALAALDDLPRGTRKFHVEQESAQVRILKAQRTRATVAQQLASALNDLRRILRFTHGETLEPEGRLPAPSRLSLPLDALLAVAQSHRVDLQAHKNLATWSDQQLELARRNWIPNISLSGFVSDGDGDQQYGGGIGFPLPVFQSPGVDVQAAVVELDRARREEDAVADKVNSEVRAAYDAIVAAQSDWATVNDEILPRLKRIAEAQDAAFDAGRADAAAIIDAELDVVDGKRDEVTARGTYAAAWVELERAVGTSIDDATAAAPAQPSKAKGDVPPPARSSDGAVDPSPTPR